MQEFEYRIVWQWKKGEAPDPEFDSKIHPSHYTALDRSEDQLILLVESLNNGDLGPRVEYMLQRRVYSEWETVEVPE